LRRSDEEWATFGAVVEETGGTSLLSTRLTIMKAS